MYIYSRRNYEYNLTNTSIKISFLYILNYMLFRSNKGTLIEIKKYDFPNDKLYYQKIINIKKPIVNLSKEISFLKTMPKL